jgi:aminoglycoside 2''-phosphotransferase
MNDKKTRLTDRIRAVYPRIDIHSAKLDQSGQNNDILLINGDIIFRFPRYRIALDSIQAEAAVLETIKGRVPLPVPELEYLSLDGLAGGEVFTGYARLPGVPFLRDVYAAIGDEPVRKRLAEQLAGFLKALHSTPLDQIAIKLSHSDTRAECEDIFERMRVKLFPHMRPDARQWAADHYESFLTNPANFDYQPVLKHGDFGTTNILFDLQKQDICGIIDFGNAALGDPAYDFAGLLSSYGERFLTNCARTYPEINNFLPRVRFYLDTFALLEALFGAEHDDQSAYDAGMEKYV